MLPSEITYDSEAASELAQRYPSAYKAALAKELALDARLRETIIPSLPLVFLPGSCTLANGKPLRPNYRSGTSLTLYFSDKNAQETLGVALHCQVGVLVTATHRA